MVGLRVGGRPGRGQRWKDVQGREAVCSREGTPLSCDSGTTMGTGATGGKGGRGATLSNDPEASVVLLARSPPPAPAPQEIG